MLTVSTVYFYTAHYDCNLLYIMAAREEELNVRVLESYVTARNSFVHWVNKWFYSDPTVSEVCDWIVYTVYKFSEYGQIRISQTGIHVNLD